MNLEKTGGLGSIPTDQTAGLFFLPVYFFFGSANTMTRVEITMTAPSPKSRGSDAEKAFAVKSAGADSLTPKVIRYANPKIPLIKLTASAPQASFLFPVIAFISQLFFWLQLLESLYIPPPQFPFCIFYYMVCPLAFP